MTRKTRLLQEDDLSGVAALLKRAFGEGISVADVDSLRWKYLRPGPAWDGPRGFVADQDGAIVGFAGLIPGLFLSPGKAPVTSLVVTDWAAVSTSPGVGVAIYAHAIRRAETAFLVGGVEVTREVVPKLGFRPFADATIYSRWVRPWREFWQREKSVRAVQRLGHAVLHQLRPKPFLPGRWTATSVDRFDAGIEPVLGFRPTRRTTFGRTLASLNHMLECPRSPMRGYVLQENSRIRGYAIVAFIGWEARLVDVNVDGERPEDWVAAYGAVSTIVRKDPNVCRIRAMAAVPDQQHALVQNGFWVNQHEPFMLFDPKGRAPDLPLDLQFFESDLGYA